MTRLEGQCQVNYPIFIIRLFILYILTTLVSFFLDFQRFLAIVNGILLAQYHNGYSQ